MAELTDHVSNVRKQLALLATSVADRLDEMDQSIGGSLESTEPTDSFEDEDETQPDVSAEEPAEAPAENMEAFSLDDGPKSESVGAADDASVEEEDEDDEDD